MDLMVVIAPSLITGLVSLLVCIITQSAAGRKTTVTMEQRLDLLEYKFDKLCSLVDKHNNIIEKTFELEKRTDIQEEKIKELDHKVEKIEVQLRK